MEALIESLLDLAGSLPTELSGTAGALRLTATRLRYGADTPANAAAYLRGVAAASRREAVTFMKHPPAAAVFIRRAEVLDEAAAVLEGEVA